MLVSTNMSKVPSSLKVMPTNSNPKVHAFIIARYGHINQQFFWQLLTSHAMPYTLAHVSLCHSGSPSKAHWIYPLKIQSVPPTYRKKSDWYCDQMDPLIKNDIQSLHWSLSPAESRCLLEAISPDKMLFPCTTEPSKLLSMTQLLDSLQNQGIYRRSNTNDGIECWHQFSLCHSKGTELNIAKFLNGILKAVEKVVRISSIQMLVFLLHLTTCIDIDGQSMACQWSHFATQRLRCKSQAWPHTPACIGCQIIKRSRLEGHHCFQRDQVQMIFWHTKKILHQSSGENYTSPLHTGWKALSTMRPDFGPPHHPHILQLWSLGLFQLWHSISMKILKFSYVFYSVFLQLRWLALGWTKWCSGIAVRRRGCWLHGRGPVRAIRKMIYLFFWNNWFLSQMHYMVAAQQFGLVQWRIPLKNHDDGSLPKTHGSIPCRSSWKGIC